MCKAKVLRKGEAWPEWRGLPFEHLLLNFFFSHVISCKIISHLKWPKPIVWVLLPRDGRQKSQWHHCVKISLSSEQRHSEANRGFLKVTQKWIKSGCTNPLMKKFQLGMSSKSGGDLHTSLRSKSLSSFPKGAEATQNVTHRTESFLWSKRDYLEFMSHFSPREQTKQFLWVILPTNCQGKVW